MEGINWTYVVKSRDFFLDKEDSARTVKDGRTMSSEDRWELYKMLLV